MSAAEAELEQLFRRSLVRIDGPDGSHGSGVWVAPGLVLTCAHVAGTGDVEITWEEIRAPGRLVEAVPPRRRDPDQPWPWPDLALLEVAGIPDHPCAWLSDQRLSVQTPLFLLGHSTVYQRAPQVSSASGRYGGPQEVDGAEMWRFTTDEVAHGMSGGPVLDLRNGAVCAIVKSTRLPDSTMGGVVIPIAGLRAFSPHARAMLWSRHDQHHTGGVWAALREGLRRHPNRVPASINAVEEAELLGLLSGVRVDVDLPVLYQRAADRLAPSSLAGLREVANALMDRLTPAAGLHPLLAFTAHLSQLTTGRPRDELLRWTEQVAIRRGESDRYVQWRRTAEKPEETTDQPSVTVQIAPGALDPNRYMVTVWVSRRAGHSEKFYCDDSGTHTINELRAMLPDLVKIPLKQLHGWAIVEFVIPPDLLDERFEEIAVGRRSRLGRTNPVVLRDLERLAMEETWHGWRARWQSLRSGRGAVEWLDCDDHTDPDALDGRLRNGLDIATVAVPRNLSGTLRELLDVAVDAGVPTVVWRRHECPGHDERPCSGDMFRAGLEKELGAHQDLALPELVRKLRSAMAAGLNPECSGIVLLWDDPTRLPEPEAPLLGPTA
ncbi:trypsin-like peptidase domain-containing protein [Actinoplanes sp. LDG1-06]|uniref:Trypsin-like peptidase domain-containing protein n=1 Tax=Paractinoplanes ovalisporus TaxID=2810368 RepID=A0ABS2AAI0_9ACTN|nr:trypsin-like peptidase domain-containing protein [Actinoplanes ovalisporus]MBM2616249.1 trypsin-like peptidase domain-containing protein [Actinoplanes ovalisporus]